MPMYYHNPENALKRANEFYELGKEDEAIECLSDALRNRKGRMVKNIHEIIIKKLLELCVEHRRSQTAKDGLFNYRNLCQGINIKSWEDTVSSYLKLTENKVENAQEAFHSVLLDIDDLDQDITPDILLKSVSNEGTQERTERVILLPWIKCLWECYRNCLDLLRNTQSFKLYHTVAKNAFRFCVKFSRKSELRKLCNVLKMQAIYSQTKPGWLKKADAEAHLICLDTSFVELDSAITMELWQDAFRAIENIHALLSVSKYSHHSKIIAHYYLKISRVFWKGEEYLFHAAANLQYFLILKDQKKNLNSYYIAKLASRLLISILAVPHPSVNPTIDLMVDTDVTVIERKNKLFTSLLNLPKLPSRSSLIKDVIQFNINQYLPQELANIFDTFENISYKVFPSISKFINLIKTWANGELEEYVPLIQKVLIAKLIPVLSSLYTNIKLTRLLRLIGIAEMSNLESMLADAARKYDFPVRIDQINMYVHFPYNFNILENQNGCYKENLRHDSHLRRLINIHSALKNAVGEIHPELRKNECEKLAEKITKIYFSEKDFYRKSLLQRKTVIEKHKESLEKSRIKREEDEKRRITEKLLQYETAEKMRLMKETEERKLEQFRREQEEIKRKIFMEKMETFKKSVLGNQIIENLEFEKIESLDPNIFLSKQVEQMNKERKQLQLRLRRQERAFIHFERAKRLEEIPLLNEQYAKEKETDELIWNEAIKNKIHTAVKKREQEVLKKNRVLKIKPDLCEFLQSVKKRHLESSEKEMSEFTKLLQTEKEKRLKKRAEERKQKRREHWIKQQTCKLNKETELKHQSFQIRNGDDNQNSYQKTAKNQNFKSILSPKKPSMNPIVEEINFGEGVISPKQNIPYPVPKKGKYDTVETSKKMHFSRDMFYYKRIYKFDGIETERTEVYKRRPSIFSEISTDIPSKSRSQNERSEIYSVSDKKIRTNMFESNNDATLLSWRTPWARKDSYIDRNNPYNKGNEVPPQNISILRRETMSETASLSKDKTNFESLKQKLSNSENQKSGIKYSCTPWAKVKRDDFEK